MKKFKRKILTICNHTKKLSNKIKQSFFLQYNDPRIFFYFRTYCLIGDGESAEGSIWEALHFASFYNLDNLCAIFDVNRLGQSEATSLQHNMEVYRKRLEAFGFNAIVVDGHDVEELVKVRRRFQEICREKWN